MDVTEILKKIDELKKPYLDAKNEIEYINARQYRAFDENKSVIKLYEYQKDFIINLHRLNLITVIKCRCSGYTTAWLLHVIEVLHNYFISGVDDNIPSFLYITHSDSSAHASKQLLDYYIKANDSAELSELYNSVEFYRFIKKHIVFTSIKNCASKICGRCYEAAMFDECAYFESDYNDVIVSLFGTGIKNIALVSSVRDEQMRENFKITCKRLLVKYKKSYTFTYEDNWWDCPEYTETHWWECPVFNKNLVWKKIKVEPVIDTEGNVKYDMERWQKLINDGWIPTSEKFEKMSKCLGLGEIAELLN